MSGEAPVCLSCRKPDPECDCPAEYVNEYKPRAAREAAEDIDEDGYGS